MLRITTSSTAESLTFQLEGRLVGPWVTELRHCWEKNSFDTKRSVHIDLRAVTYVDAAGEALLAELYRQGANLVACDCQMKAVVADIQARSSKRYLKERNNHGSGTSKTTL